ncbi:TIGR02391 family protein [Streptomyces sp. NBC_01185]|nr:TIGR02391 family protein [Streptomyces sp. NBC_01185]
MLAPSKQPRLYHARPGGGPFALHRDDRSRRAAPGPCREVRPPVRRKAAMDATNVYEKVFASKNPMLAWPGDPSDRTVSSMQNGLAKYAPGVDMTVRNTATHVASDEMTAQQALERLATLSLLAGWIDELEGPI